jgi:hypothetical protein
MGNLHKKVTHHRSWFYLAMNRCPCQSPADECAWRFMAKWFSVREFVSVTDATLCSGSVRTAIVDSAIAAWLAASKPGCDNAGPRTVATSGVRKAGSIIGTGNAPTGSAGRKPA